jgi:hypothetical protein
LQINKIVEPTLYPQGSSEIGFLKPEQNLKDLIQSDRQILKQHNVTQKESAQVLAAAYNFAMRSGVESHEGVVEIYKICPINSFGSD